MTGETAAELRARLAMAPVFSRHKSTEWVALAVTDRDAIDGMLAHLVVVEAERDRLKQVQRHYGSTTWQDHLTSALEENEELLARLAAAEAEREELRVANEHLRDRLDRSIDAHAKTLEENEQMRAAVKEANFTMMGQRLGPDFEALARHIYANRLASSTPDTAEEGG